MKLTQKITPFLWFVSWQVNPKILGELLADPDKEKAARVMQAMLGMKKIDVAQLQRVYDGE